MQPCGCAELVTAKCHVAAEAFSTMPATAGVANAQDCQVRDFAIQIEAHPALPTDWPTESRQ